MEEVMAKSSPKVSPAQVRTARACSTGSAMAPKRASASAASSGVGRTAVVTRSLPSRSGGPRRRAGTRRSAMHLASPRTGSALRPRSTGRRTPGHAGFLPTRSQQPGFLGAVHVGGERLAVLPPLEVAPQHPLAVVRRLGLGDLVTAELAAERGVGTTEVPAEVHLEALDHLAGV